MHHPVRNLRSLPMLISPRHHRTDQAASTPRPLLAMMTAEASIQEPNITLPHLHAVLPMGTSSTLYDNPNLAIDREMKNIERCKERLLGRLSHSPDFSSFAKIQRNHAANKFLLSVDF
jgi:hypothetical protein